jgi:hypothetical protein
MNIKQNALVFYIAAGFNFMYNTMKDTGKINNIGKYPGNLYKYNRL